MVSELFLSIIIGFFLDLIIGDPYSMPHPIKVYGHAIAYGEKLLNKNKNRKLKGGIMAVGLIILSYLFFKAKFLCISNCRISICFLWLGKPYLD